MTTDDFGAFSWERIPGAFELLENGKLNEEQPDFAQIPKTDIVREVSFDELNARWRSFVHRLQGYRQTEILFKKEPFWLPIIELHVPPGGKATLEYNRKSNKEKGAEIKVFGFGFGTGLSTSLSQSVRFSADQLGKSFQVKLLATATRYSSPDGHSLIRFDVESPNDARADKVVDIPIPDWGDKFNVFDPFEWTIVHRVDLTGSTDKGMYTWQKATTEQTKWQVGIGIVLPQNINLSPKWTIELEKSNEFRLTYEMPYGHEYIFYHRTDNTPLIPMCTLSKDENGKG